MVIAVHGLAAKGLAALALAFRLFGSAGDEGHLVTADAGSPLNPHNVLGIRRRANSADVTTFLELVPESKRWKLHAKLRASDEDAASHTARGQLGELYAQWSVRPWLDLTAGRRIEKWGTGYAWNPTGFVNPPKSPGDPNDRRNARRGVDMLRADLFIRDTNVSAYLLPRAGEKPAYALRAYRLIRGTDVSLTARSGGDAHGAAGISVAHVFGDALEVHAEAASVTGCRLPVAGSDETACPSGSAPATARHSELLLGAQYTFAGGLNIVAEAYHGGGGLSAERWDAFRGSVDDARIALGRGDVRPLVAANRAYAPLRMGRDYAFMRVAWPVVRDHLDLETIAIASLRDGSSLLRATVSWRVTPGISVYVVQTGFIAGRGSEFDYMQVKRLTDAGVRVYF
ncbi:MAG: hypothetical protein JWO56_1545 [Acidobacteria bacterium]|nr:hypothetical protein [Acidobacteriota bacterium]